MADAVAIFVASPLVEGVMQALQLYRILISQHNAYRAMPMHDC